MSAGWTTEETRALVGVWGQANVQSELDGVTRNRSIYARISKELGAVGYEKTWQQKTTCTDYYRYICQTRQAFTFAFSAFSSLSHGTFFPWRLSVLCAFYVIVEKPTATPTVQRLSVLCAFYVIVEKPTATPTVQQLDVELPFFTRRTTARA